MVTDDQPRGWRFLKKIASGFVDRGNEDEQRSYWGAFASSLELDDALRAVLTLPSGPSDPTLLKEWTATGLPKAQALGLSHRPVHPKCLLEFLEFKHPIPRIGLAAVRSTGHLSAIVTPDVDRDILRGNVDLADELGAELFPRISQIHHQNGFSWTDAAFLASRGVGSDWLTLLIEAVGKQLSREDVLDVRSSGLSLDGLATWWPSGLSLRDIRRLAYEGVSFEQWEKLSAIGIRVQDIPSAVRVWGDEAPATWMDVLACGYPQALSWRERLSDLRLAEGWARATSSVEEFDRYFGAGLDLASLIRWRRVGLDDADEILHHHSSWDPDTCGEWVRELQVGEGEALEWFDTGQDLHDCRKWTEAGVGITEATRASSLGVDAVSLVEFRRHGVNEVEEVRRHLDTWTARELGVWSETLKADPDIALDWRGVVDDPVEADRWAGIGLTPEEAERFITCGLTATSASEWVGLGVTDLGELVELLSAGVEPDAFKRWSVAVGRDVDRVLDWVGSGVGVEVAEVLCVVVADPAEALVWARLPVEGDDRLRLIGAGVGADCVDGFLRLGVSSVSDLVEACGLWSPADALAWMDGLSCDYRTALSWFRSGSALNEAQVCGSLQELQGWMDLGVRGADTIEYIRSRMAVVDAREFQASGWKDLSAAANWSAAGFDAPAALAWSQTGLAIADVAVLIEAGLDSQHVSGWVGLGATDPSQIIELAIIWGSVTTAKSWTSGLGCDLAEAQAWRESVAELSKAAVWRPFTDPTGAQAWIATGESPSQAQQWVAAGAAEPVEAARWLRAGFTSADCGGWVQQNVDPGLARECVDEGMSPAEFTRAAAQFPGSESAEVVWLWSLERAGLASHDAIPTATVSSGRPVDALAQIEEVVLIALANGVSQVRIVHYGADLNVDLVRWMKDPVFVRGAGRVALAQHHLLDPELCIEDIEHHGDESLIRVTQVAPRRRFLRRSLEVEVAV